MASPKTVEREKQKQALRANGIKVVSTHPSGPNRAGRRKDRKDRIKQMVKTRSYKRS